MSVRYEFYAIFCFLLPYFRIERGKLRYLDKGTVAFLLDNLIGDGELVVSRFLGKDDCPCIKTVDTLLLQSLWAQILEQEIQLRQAIGNSRSRKESGSQVLSGPFLYGTNSKEHV